MSRTTRTPSDAQGALSRPPGAEWGHYPSDPAPHRRPRRVGLACALVLAAVLLGAYLCLKP